MTPPGRRVLGVLTAAAAAALASGRSLPEPAGLVALSLASLLGPGALLVSIWGGERTPPERHALALALSPALWGGLVAVLVVVGRLDVPAAARWTAAAVAVLSLWRVFRPPARVARDDDAAATRAAWIAAVLWGAGCGALLAFNRWLPLRSDGWFHAGVALEIARHGLPPEDPYFAGLRLLYFWGYHLWVASWWTLVPSLGVRAPLVLFQASAAAAVVLAVCAAARPFARGAPAAATAAVLTLAGYAPGAWLWIVPRAAFGDVRGWDELHRIASAGIEAMAGVMSTGLLHVSLVFFGDKYLLPTPFGMGLALFVLGTLAMVRQATNPGRHEVPMLAAITAAGLFTHTVIGDVLLLMLAITGIVRFGRGVADPIARRRFAGLAIAGAAGLAVTLPYVLEITLGKRSEQLSLRTSWQAWYSLIFGAGCLLPLGIAGLARSRTRTDSRALGVLAIALALMALFVKLPENNQSKFFNLLQLLLVGPATAASLAALGGVSRRVRALLLAAFVVAVVPTFAVSVWSYAADRGGSPMAWHEPDAAHRAGLDWARRELPEDAVIADLAGAQDLFVFVQRPVIWGGPSGERDWGYPHAEMEARRMASRDLVAGREPGPAARLMLAGLGRPVVVIARGDTAGDSVYAPARGFRRLYRDAVTGWYAWEPAR